MLRFSDGITMDTSGELRLKEEYDGWYVLGEGMMIPVNSREEGIEYIEQRKAKKTDE